MKLKLANVISYKHISLDTWHDDMAAAVRTLEYQRDQQERTWVGQSESEVDHRDLQSQGVVERSWECYD